MKKQQWLSKHSSLSQHGWRESSCDYQLLHEITWECHGWTCVLKNFDAWRYIFQYCTTQVYRLISRLCIIQPTDEYLFKPHFSVEETPKLVKLYWKIIPDAVDYCFHNWKFPATPISFFLFDNRFQIRINSVGITWKIYLSIQRKWERERERVQFFLPFSRGRPRGLFSIIYQVS